MLSKAKHPYTGIPGGGRDSSAFAFAQGRNDNPRFVGR